MPKNETAKKISDRELALLLRKERAKSGPKGLNPVFLQYSFIICCLDQYLTSKGYSTSGSRPW